MPHSLINLSESSLNLPDFCIAIRIFSSMKIYDAYNELTGANVDDLFNI
jgi:hypothetical protein